MELSQLFKKALPSRSWLMFADDKMFVVVVDFHVWLIKSKLLFFPMWFFRSF